MNTYTVKAHVVVQADTPTGAAARFIAAVGNPDYQVPFEVQQLGPAFEKVGAVEVIHLDEEDYPEARR